MRIKPVFLLVSQYKEETNVAGLGDEDLLFLFKLCQWRSHAMLRDFSQNRSCGFFTVMGLNNMEFLLNTIS